MKKGASIYIPVNNTQVSWGGTVFSLANPPAIGYCLSFKMYIATLTKKMIGRDIEETLEQIFLYKRDFNKPQLELYINTT